MKYRISAEARQDLADILVYSAQQFGLAARKRYQSLLVGSFNLIATDPYGPVSRARDELYEGLRSLHLAHAQRGIPSEQRVGQPRHVVFYRMAADDVIEIVRLLHDLMEPTEYLANP
ncbi:type II toxin-antitoxin system RelE/ParE family toxin [Pseudomonas oryzihabitans]|uniref:type II toxin-antitoxin system RelE/ParE family toxin n=1 Tax=Pseudomonas oryzihabitans TaxID=47885 RepID=UPI002B1CE305|nr:type II toxin-antitoxin system RelE/ParE family toxin [Pseudomonas oryzihabitans]